MLTAVAGNMKRMLRLIGLVVSIGLADSMNPSTIAPALYLAAGERPLQNVSQFTAAVFGTYAVGGALIVLGPGEGLLALVPHPDATARYIAETVAGAVMLVAAALLWRSRARLRARRLPSPSGNSRSSALLGLTITIVELPTALPYFAAIAAVVGSGLGLGHQLLLVLIYNVCFVLPLLAIVATVAIAGEGAEQILRRARDGLQRHWPEILAGLALVVGLFVVVLGVTGLAGAGHGKVAGFSRRLRRAISR